jgi:hypothetical protein
LSSTSAKFGISSLILSSASAKFGISSFLQPLQFDICIQFLQLFWYLHSVSAIISVFHQEDICLVSAIFVQFLQFGILFSAAFSF